MGSPRSFLMNFIYTSTINHVITKDMGQYSYLGSVLRQSTLMSFICASVVNHDITKVMGQ
jgi:hypothetical protein